MGELFFTPSDFFKNILGKTAFGTYFSCKKSNPDNLPENTESLKKINCRQLKPKDQASCLLLQPHGQFFDHLANRLCTANSFEALFFEMNLLKKAVPRSAGVKRTLPHEYPWYVESRFRVQFPNNVVDERVKEFIRNHPDVTLINIVDHLPLSLRVINNILNVFGKYSSESIKITVTLDCLVYRQMQRNNPESVKRLVYLSGDIEYMHLQKEPKTMEYINFLEEAACQKGGFEQIQFIITVTP